MFEIERLNLTYPGAAQPSIQDVSLSVAAGEFVTLLGPSGCGKTSTLRCVAGLETPGSGAISIGTARVFDSERRIDVPTHARDIAMVFQSYAVWPHMSVQQNIAFPLQVAKRPGAEVRRRVGEVLDMVGLAPLAARSATQLSGGQQQRVAIARALVRRSKAMLLDEPLSNLDAKLREQMRVELRQLLKTVGMTAIYVTHDQEEALMLSDRIAVMNAGRIVEAGTPHALYFTPRSVFSATFLGAAEVFAVKRRDANAVETDIGRLRLDEVPGTIDHVAIRPEAIRVFDASVAGEGANRFDGTLTNVVFSGRQQQLSVQVGPRLLQVLTEPTARFAAGERVVIELPPHRLMALKND